MQISRKKSRKFLFQELYSSKFNDFKEEAFFNSFYYWTFSFNLDKNYIEEVKKIIEDKKDFLNSIIIKYAPKFNIENMSIIYILPIYISLSEMFFLNEEIPGKVSINEAIELIKYFWDESWKKIVNWILNKVLEDYEEIKKDIR